jgi:O-antigen ligase
MFVQILVETGIVGSAIIGITALWGVRNVNRQRKSGSAEASILLGLFTLILILGSESNLLSYTAADYLSACVIGLLTAKILGGNRSELTSEISTRGSDGNEFAGSRNSSRKAHGPKTWAGN